ncbi:acyl-CoA dehydrogenase family protein [Saccharopolyspora sp. TS4A08]|uniref:Acyl-CoA dehydrogenase family protein n=1 Tax=Saccharopolyspora ipomoeae TaxID=3042027 RepID=A0ABT6PTT2_9PSEU|nr:acyl-CoA dehydrogenase family protein [Saccharopolyspora sp. TS4A08]MDI2031414.1 acyl-CoA dehydrogenase family protein [Saccharopolyspora sp. TS4A08]
MTTNPDLPRLAAAARPVLERNRETNDHQRRLSDETVACLTDTGLLRALVPARFGGGECRLRTAIDATCEIAKADPSAGWVVMILGSGAFISGLFPARAQEEVYADGPDASVCTVLAPRSTARQVDGGWVLSGRWAPASGCLHAQWAMLGFPGGDGGGSLALVPMTELTVEDTWYTVGMRATGSNLLAGTDLFVPDHRVLPLSSAVHGRFPAGLPEPRYRAAVMPALASYMIAPYLGMATAVLDHVVAGADTKGIAFSHYERQRDSTAFQLAVAEATTKIDVARLIAENSAAVVDGHADAGTFPDQLARARVRLHTGHAAQLCRQAVDDLVTAHGASAFAESNPLQAYVRDIHAASRHAVANPASCSEIFGRALLGVEPNITDMI